MAQTDTSVVTFEPYFPLNKAMPLLLIILPQLGHFTQTASCQGSR